MTDKIIYEFDKGPNSKVRITENEFNNRIYYHLRVFGFMNGNWYPTKTGISFGKDDLDSLFDGIKALKDYIFGGDQTNLDDVISDLDGNP